MNHANRARLLTLFFFSVALAPSAEAAPPAPSGELAYRWNALALDGVRARSLVDAAAARSYAMMNVAMYDAVWGIQIHFAGRRAHALVPPNGAPANGDIAAAAAQAAHDVLVALFPELAAAADAQLASDLAALDTGAGRVQAGVSWGAEVARQVLAARANDGSSPNETQPGGFGPGQFRADWSNTQFRNLAPFAIANPAVYVGSGPPPLGSVDYAAALAEVRVLGNQALPDADKLATFQFWNLPGGTDQPPGAWLQIVAVVGSARALPLTQATRLGALVTMAMADTVAPTYQTKFQFHAWRPTTAIREADTDGNPSTDPDPAWTARAGAVGGTPESWSGHSSFSAAAGAVLAGFFCTDKIPFSFASDSAPGGQVRSYPGFSAAVAEAGRSRVMGGIHFQFSNLAGLSAGRAVAGEILAGKLLLLTSGPTHFGACPL
jgi:hypothetical protein